MSEAVIQSVLSYAYEFRMMMSAQGGMAGLGKDMARTLDSMRSQAANGAGVHARG